jgi:phage baseplate assembly protein W
MYTVVNTVPTTNDETRIKTIAFPYQRGVMGFPAMAQYENNVFMKIYSLLTTGVGDRVMTYDFGINLNEYTFKNLTPIQRARLANAVSNAIETFIPGVIVNDVRSTQVKHLDGVGTEVGFWINYTVNGETYNQQVPYVPVSKGL